MESVQAKMKNVLVLGAKINQVEIKLQIRDLPNINLIYSFKKLRTLPLQSTYIKSLILD